MKKIKAILCAMLAVCLMAVPLSSAVVFDAGGVEDVQSLQDQIKALDEKSAEYQAILDATQTDINEKEQYGEALISKIQVLNDKVILTRQSRVRSTRCANACASYTWRAAPAIWKFCSAQRILTISSTRWSLLNRFQLMTSR